MMMKTALVCGGAGFIGSHLVKKLLNQNLRVVCVDNLISGDRRNITDLFANPSFRFVEKNIVDKFEDEKPDFIFHLASPASPNKKSPRSYINFPVETLLANSSGTYNLLEIAKKNKSKFLYASSSEVYGDPQISPQKEDYFGNVNPTGIRSVYDEGKRFGEAITMAYFRKYSLDCRIVRIFNTYGPKMLSDGSRGEVINLGNPDEKTIFGLANLIKKLTNSKSEIVFEPLPEDDPKVRKPDIEKAKKLLSWEPKVSIDQGLLKTIKYFRAL